MIVIITAVLLVISINVACANEYESSFSYNSNVIELGDYAYTVMKKCGTCPIYITRINCSVEHWVYDLDFQHYYLKFINKKLVSIEAIYL